MTFNFIRETTADHTLWMCCVHMIFVSLSSSRQRHYYSTDGRPKDINIVFTFCHSNRRHFWVVQSPACHYFVNYTIIRSEMMTMALYCPQNRPEFSLRSFNSFSVLFSWAFTWNVVNWDVFWLHVLPLTLPLNFLKENNLLCHLMNICNLFVS